MNHFFRQSILATAVVSALAMPMLANAKSTAAKHTDFRQGIKLAFPADPTQTKQASLEVATNYLKQHQQSLQLTAIFKNLRLLQSRKSLLGTHYVFQQYLDAIPVHSATITVSVNKQGEVFKVYNNTYPAIAATETTSDTSKAHGLQTGDAATQKVWNHLKPTGELKGMPQASLAWLNVGKRFVLAHKVELSLSEPEGDWRAWVDAKSGQLIQLRRIDLPLKTNANAGAKAGKWHHFSHPKSVKSLADAINEFKAKQNQQKAHQVSLANKASGTALVFDPDPRTHLNDSTIEDTTAAESFDPAYVNVTLQDITERNGTYSLEGPWVAIQEWDAPSEAPSTTTDGNWTAKRGDNAFNDAMTYYHIDQNQRYIQSLGFVGDKGIQQGPIGVDTNGANGADNSYFSPAQNKLSFGHGCVDDNEDIDVILHEYGHALTFSINPNFDGGDSGAIGEGFGDYWAASYSYSTPNGRSFHPEWAFSWDGHNNCWPGRLLNQTSFRYDPTQTYAAHAQVNGELGDELWSTPITQAHLDLLDAGIPRSQIDQIILEAQFGLGYGVTMRDMANSIVDAANKLFPDGPHATTFYNHFLQMNILPEPITLGELAITSAGNDNVVDPGDTVQFDIPIENAGLEKATSVSATITTTASGVTINTASSDYADIAKGESQTNTQPYEIALSADYTCGVDIPLNVTTSYSQNGAQSKSFDLVIPVGAGTETRQSASPAASIPDNNSTGISQQLTLSGATANSHISVDMDITHTYRGDLTLTLTSPQGTSVILQKSSNDGNADIRGNYPNDLTPEESLSAFDGEDHNGVWTLKIVDGGAQDIGTLNSWAIISTSPRTCNGGTTPANQPPTASVANASVSVDEGATVTLDASGSSDPDGDTLTYSWTQTAGPTVTLNAANSAQASFTAPEVSTTTSLSFEVTVSDNTAGSDKATVMVTVNNKATPPSDSGSGSSGGGGSLGLLTLLGLWLRGKRVSR